VFPMNVPVNPGPGFNQILDVLRNDIVTYVTTGRGWFTEKAADGDWKERVTEIHRELIELIAESDETLLTKFFDQGGLSEEEFRSGIHSAAQQQLFIPLFCISAETDVGVARLMDFIAKYGSSPVDREGVTALDSRGHEVEVMLTGSEPLAQVFKTMNEEHFGELWFFRVYSGSVKIGTDLFNVTRGITERIGQIYLLNGRERTAVSELRAGDLGATVKLKYTHTGDTLCSPGRPVKLPVPVYPKPTLHAALQPKARGEEDKIAAGLATLREEDPALFSPLIRNCARRSSPRRASCISMSSPSGSVAASMSISISWSLACAFGKRSKRLPKRIIATRSSRAVLDSLARWRSVSHRQCAIQV
jgi:elongation factor G